MGMDPQGILFYGIAYAEEDDLFDDVIDKAWDFRIAERNKAAPQPDDGSQGYQGPAWDRWREQVAAWEPYQCNLGNRGHTDYSRPYVYVEASRKTVEWDDVEEVTSLGVPEGWLHKLKAYCEALGLPWREPKWFLAAFYG